MNELLTIMFLAGLGIGLVISYVLSSGVERAKIRRSALTSGSVEFWGRRWWIVGEGDQPKLRTIQSHPSFRPSSKNWELVNIDEHDPFYPDGFEPK